MPAEYLVPGSSDVQPLQHHPIYYFPKANHIFHVEHTLYKLYEDLLIHYSGLFDDMFAIGDATLAQDGSDKNSIVLKGERANVFDLFLDYIHGHGCRGSHSYSVDELQDLLIFAKKYHCPDMHTFIIDHIWGTRYNLHPVEIIGLGTTFKMEKAFKWGFKCLLEMPIEDISKQHRLMIGGDVFVALVYMKSVIDKHCCIIAIEEPIILSHTYDCPNPKECSEDWHAI
ncbi:hypothetical protein HD554DRAFT_2293327 [Boletus coccyginus]|nr:hypothetical protein HD554DRAFT_2293327 [Boletus coccyginus]